MELLSAATYFGDSLAFHPTSQEQLQRAAELPAHIPVVTTEDIYAGIRYQPLNLGVTIGQVRVLAASDLASEYVSPREIAVLDRVPNDISVVAGVVTAEFQTPLSHVNVLSQQRRTPNMGLRDAHERFAPHDGTWVRLEVGAFSWSVTPATQEEADAWWLAHRPDPVVVAPPDLSVTELLDIDDVGLADIPAVGGKAAHFGALRDLAAASADVKVRGGLVIPVYFYAQFLADNGFDQVIDDMLADPLFQSDGNHRRERLLALRQAMMAAPVDEALLAALDARLQAEFPGLRMRFRSSTNAEDLHGFSGAGLYDSASGEPGSIERPIAGAIRKVWASLWNTRAFEERAYVSIDSRDVAMAILVHPSYRDETANGVAITANIFDPGRGGEDGFYINVQLGETSVVQPSSYIVADQLMYYFFHDNQPATYYAHSSLVPAGTTVLSRRELFELGKALRAIRNHFRAVYDPPAGFGALPMDVEFKRLGTGESSSIEVKQARPYPGRGTATFDITY
jgi:pyruvate, water dikinase